MWRFFRSLLTIINSSVTDSSSPPADPPLEGGLAWAALLTGAIPSSPNPAFTAFTELAWSGYARQNLGAWVAGLDSQGYPQDTGAPLQWTVGGTLSLSISGVLLCNSLSGTPGAIYSAYVLATPITVVPGQIVTFVPGYPGAPTLIV